MALPDDYEQIAATLREIYEAQEGGDLEQAKAAAERLQTELRAGFKRSLGDDAVQPS